MRRLSSTHTPLLRNLITDLLLTITGVPVLAAAGYGLFMAVKTYRPNRKPDRAAPRDFGLSAESIEIPVNGSNITLQGWFLRAKASRHTVIVGHELGSNKGSKLRNAAFLYEAGYNILLFDARNHGASSADRALWPMSRRFTDDVEAVIAFVRSKPELSGGKIAIYSFSFSTFPAIYVMKRPTCVVDAVILDSGPAMDTLSLSNNFLEAYGRFIVPRIFRGPILFRIVKSTYSTIVNLQMLGVDWPPALEHLSAKLLVIANEDDDIVSATELKAFASLYPGAECWVAPQTPHLRAFQLHEQSYRDVVVDFLWRSLSQG